MGEEWRPAPSVAPLGAARTLLRTRHASRLVPLSLASGVVHFLPPPSPSHTHTHTCQIIIVDEKKKDAWEMRYDFTFEGRTTNWVPRVGEEVPYSPFDGDEATFQKRDTPLGAFAAKVDLAKEEFKVGNPLS